MIFDACSAVMYFRFLWRQQHLARHRYVCLYMCFSSWSVQFNVTRILHAFVPELSIGLHDRYC